MKSERVEYEKVKSESEKVKSESDNPKSESGPANPPPGISQNQRSRYKNAATARAGEGLLFYRLLFEPLLCFFPDSLL
mgnify:CR=1 FL=1